MPRRARAIDANFVYHVLNRAAKRIVLFRCAHDYRTFEEILLEVREKSEMRLLSYCVMPNHWHLVLWPNDNRQLSHFMQRLTVTHAQRWHTFHGTRGTGPVYQGRYKAIPVQDGEHFLRLCRYVERNPLRAKLVGRAEEWSWSSLKRRCNDSNDRNLAAWPILPPSNWLALVNGEDPVEELESLRISVRRGAPYGEASWVESTASHLGLNFTLRPRGRPKKIPVPFLQKNLPVP